MLRPQLMLLLIRSSQVNRLYGPLLTASSISRTDEARLAVFSATSSFVAVISRIELELSSAFEASASTFVESCCSCPLVCCGSWWDSCHFYHDLRFDCRMGLCS